MRHYSKKKSYMKKNPVEEDVASDKITSTNLLTEFPKTVRARWRTYFIKYVENCDNNLMGCVDFHSGKIIISNKLCEDEQKATILHELFHAHLYDIGLSYTFSLKQIELLCQIFGSTVIDFIRENPDIVRWIQNQRNSIPTLTTGKEKAKKQRTR